MKLVRIENYQLVVDDELLLLTPFRKLYKKDKTRDKSNFIEFLTIVYFTYDPRSDYSYIVDDDKRLAEVCRTNGFEVPKFSEEQQACVDLYKQLTTTISQELLRSAKIAISKIQNFLESVDLTEEDDKGKPKYGINMITSTIKQIPQLSKDIQEAERTVAKEIAEQGRARGGNETKTLMDDHILC